MRKGLAPTAFVLAFLLGLSLSASGQSIDESKIIDLTYDFDSETVYWPTARSFTLEEVAHGPTEQGYFYAANDFCTAEHGGTHMDAPIHFSQGKLPAGDVPLGAGIGPLARIDVSAKASANPDYRLTVEDLKRWEAAHGAIPPGAIVVMYSGWGEHWPDRKRILGTDKQGDTQNLHFPGFSKEAVAFLLAEREIDAIGVDTPSLDYGQSRDFIVHQLVGGANKPGFENLANLDRVPSKGAMLIALPMKIRRGSGGPVRAIAILP